MDTIDMNAMDDEETEAVWKLVKYLKRREADEAATALAALVAERDALRMCAEAGGELLKAIDAGRMRQRVGVTGQTMDAQLRASVYDGVPAYPVEEAREKYTLARAALTQGGEKP
jgi:hypothetical protein